MTAFYFYIVAAIIILIIVFFTIRKVRAQRTKAPVEQEYPYCPQCGFELFYETDFTLRMGGNGFYVCGFCRALVSVNEYGKVELRNNDAAKIFPQAEATPLIFYGTDGCKITNQSIRNIAEG